MVDYSKEVPVTEDEFKLLIHLLEEVDALNDKGFLVTQIMKRQADPNYEIVDLHPFKASIDRDLDRLLVVIDPNSQVYNNLRVTLPLLKRDLSGSLEKINSSLKVINDSSPKGIVRRMKAEAEYIVQALK
jgi:hypothetical protein